MFLTRGMIAETKAWCTIFFHELIHPILASARAQTGQLATARLAAQGAIQAERSRGLQSCLRRSLPISIARQNRTASSAAPTFVKNARHVPAIACGSMQNRRARSTARCRARCIVSVRADSFECRARQVKQPPTGALLAPRPAAVGGQLWCASHLAPTPHPSGLPPPFRKRSGEGV